MLRAVLMFPIQVILWTLVITLSGWGAFWNTTAFVERMRRVSELGRSRRGELPSLQK